MSFCQEVSGSFSDKRSTPAVDGKPKLLPKRQVAERYSVSTRTVDRWVADLKLGFARPVVIRGRAYFTETELEQFERRRVAAA
jgi:hypothetical protein